MPEFVTEFVTDLDAAIAEAIADVCIRHDCLPMQHVAVISYVDGHHDGRQGFAVSYPDEQPMPTTIGLLEYGRTHHDTMLRRRLVEEMDDEGI